MNDHKNSPGLSHIVISTESGLLQADLRDLGHLNIICGKNNSGKSTLLSHILNADRSAQGHVFTEDDSEYLYNQSIRDTPWHGTDPIENTIYKQILGSTLVGQLLTDRDEGKLYETVSDTMRRHPRLKSFVTLNASPLIRAFRECFRPRSKAILVPPKRSLEARCAIDTHRRVNAAGSGIVNTLFTAKNRIHRESADQNLYAQVQSAFREISSGFRFELELMPGNEVSLSFASPSGTWLSADSCGLGLQDLIVLLYFAFETEYPIVGIEEPESHLHPEMQRKLLGFLQKKEEKQFFLTTHSNVFLDATFVDRVFYTYFDRSIQVDDATSRAAILNELGYSVTDNLVSDLIILVEGITDTPIINEFLVKLNLLPRFVIKTWPLFGDQMTQVDLSVFAERYKIFALLDNDPKSKSARTAFEVACKAYHIEVFRLSRYAIENYFSLHAVKEVFKSQVPEGLQALSPDTPLEDQLGFRVKNRTRILAQLTTLGDIDGTDLRQFFTKVEEACRGVNHQ